MFCCCRQKLDITEDSASPVPTKPAAQTDSEKEKAFSEAVTAHPSPAVTPVSKQITNNTATTDVPTPAQPEPLPNQPPSQEAATKPVEERPTVEETVTQTAANSVDTAATAKANVSVINVVSPGTKSTSNSFGATLSFNRDTAILSQIETLSQTIEKAASAGELKGRESCSVYANQLSVLTSQVQKEASSMSESALQNAVSRLESVAARLESLALNSGSSGSGAGGETAPFVTAFDDLLSGSFAKFLTLSASIGGDVKTQVDLVNQAFQAERQFLVVASKSKEPAAASLGPIVQPVAQKLSAAQEFRESNRRSEFFNHLSAISESVAALGWITVTPAPGPFVKEMMDAGMFYTNRVLKDFKEKDATHADWVKAWLSTLRELQDYIKQFHTTGVTWNAKGGDASAAAASAAPAPAAGGAPPPPPPGPPPPPPPPPAEAPGGSSGGDDGRAALFAALNRGDAITSGLRQVTDDMKTHKNPALRQGPAPFKASAPKPVTAPKPAAAVKPAPAAKPPLIELQNKKWVVEYQNDNKTIVLDQTELKQAVYVYKCVNSVIQVKGKVNSITLDSCKKTAVVMDDLVSCLEFINCQSMQGQITGKVPTISIDKTDGCMIYLSQDSLAAEIVTAKSSEMNILVPVDGGDYKEFALPEQFKTTWNGKSMVTVQTDSV